MCCRAAISPATSGNWQLSHLVNLPIEALKRITVGGNDRELGEAGWQTYDAVVGLTNAATNRLYSNESFGRVASRAIDVTMQWQRLNLALTGAFFATLWPAVGVPTASDVAAMREDLHAFREEVRAARFEQAHHEERAQIESDQIQLDSMQIDSDSMPRGATPDASRADHRALSKADVGAVDQGVSGGQGQCQQLVKSAVTGWTARSARSTRSRTASASPPRIPSGGDALHRHLRGR